jgi:hypothetical protein
LIVVAAARKREQLRLEIGKPWGAFRKEHVGSLNEKIIAPAETRFVELLTRKAERMKGGALGRFRADSPKRKGSAGVEAEVCIDPPSRPIQSD